jgi:6-phosphogluconolactonase (cycloisomerase 2 family)
MKSFVRLASTAALAAVLVGAFALPAFADGGGQDRHDFGHSRGADHAVFVATDNTAGNQVVAYERSDSGALTLAGTYDTHGLGGSLTGAVVDRTASQGALAYDAENALLYAVNAGSNTVSVFSVRGDHLDLRQVLNSGGTFPVSVTVHDDVVYVLNARDGGSLQGFQVLFGHVFPIFGSNRALGLDPTAAPEFTHTPGQVAFTPDGSKVLVTTKANTNAVDVYRVRFDGRLSTTPVVTTFPGLVPFAVSFDRNGNAVVANAGNNSVATLAINPSGTLTQIDSDATGQAATCWIVRAGNRFYASNAGSGTLTGFQSDGAGHLSLIGNTATDAGTVDAAATAHGEFIYVQAGLAGDVDGFRVNADGTLAGVGSVTVPNAVGGEGIVAA